MRDGKVRLNGSKITKPSSKVEIGDNLVFSTSDWVRIIEVVKMGVRRGPASEAQELYLDHSGPRPVKEKYPKTQNMREKGAQLANGDEHYILFQIAVLIDWPTQIGRASCRERV